MDRFYRHMLRSNIFLTKGIIPNLFITILKVLFNIK